MEVTSISLRFLLIILEKYEFTCQKVKMKLAKPLKNGIIWLKIDT